MFQFSLVGSRHNHKTGQGRQIGRIERTCMGWSVSTDKAGPVDGKAHRQPLDGHIVDNLIVGTLQKG